MDDLQAGARGGEAAGSRRPRVLQIGMLWGQGGTAGGLDRIFTGLVSHLPEAGLDITGVVWGPDGVEALSGGLVHGFAPASATTPQRYLAARRMIGNLVKTGRPDLIAAHFPLYTFLALGRLRGVPMVVHFHGPWAAESAEEGEGRLAVAGKYLVERAVYSRAGRVIVLSRAFGEIATRRYGIDAGRVRVVPGHVDIDRFAPRHTRRAARELLGWPQDRPILFSVRRLRHRMGLDRLIAAMTRIVAAVPEALLFIGGSGPLAAALRAQATEAGLDAHVKFLGFVPEANLPLAYRAADFNVVTTVALEGFGLVAAEALAAGTPSLVTPVGGLPEVVSRLEPDLVLRSASVNDIADGLVAALRGGIKVPGDEACRAYAADAFALSKAVARTADVYREYLANPD